MEGTSCEDPPKPSTKGFRVSSPWGRSEVRPQRATCEGLRTSHWPRADAKWPSLPGFPHPYTQPKVNFIFHESQRPVNVSQLVQGQPVFPITSVPSQTVLISHRKLIERGEKSSCRLLVTVFLSHASRRPHKLPDLRDSPWAGRQLCECETQFNDPAPKFLCLYILLQMRPLCPEYDMSPQAYRLCTWSPGGGDVCEIRETLGRGAQ